jgi:type II secretory pathway component GspD/PulD (secretin)
LLAVLLNASAPQSTVVQWTGERVTVRAVNTPLRTLLEDVAQRTGIVLSGADRLAGNHTVDIRNAYLTDALQILLENVNFIVTRENGQFHLRVYSMTGHAPPTGPISIPGLTDQVVTRTDDVVQPPDPADPDNSDAADPDDDVEASQELAELERAAQSNETDGLLDVSAALQSDHSEVRIRALQLLAARPEEPDAIAEIVSAFSDADPNVVLTASDLMASIPGLAALEAIESLLTPDTSDELQIAALRSLALRGDVSSIDAVRRAAREAPPTVREFAQRLLQALEERTRGATDVKRAR